MKIPAFSMEKLQFSSLCKLTKKNTKKLEKYYKNLLKKMQICDIIINIFVKTKRSK